MPTEPEILIGNEPRRRGGLHAPLPYARGGGEDVTESRNENDPRTRAAKRAAELREHRGDLHDGVDAFAIDPRIIPAGWSYEWKVMSVLGARNPSREIAIARGGWDPVPASRHPELMPKNWTGETIERDGQCLMERPLETTNEAKDLDKFNARKQVRDKEVQIQHAPAGPSSPMERTNKGNPIGQGIRTTLETESLRVPD
jgi:hypothetical protein